MRHPAGGEDATRRQLRRLRWLTTVVPAVAAFLYETVRHSLLEQVLPTDYGNVLVGLLVLALAFGFSTLVFRLVARLQAEAVERGRELAALQAGTAERERLSRDLHDGLAQLVASLLVRIDTVEGLVAAGRLVEASGELEQLRRAGDDLYVDVRESIDGLRARVAEQGLRAALEEYTTAYAERHAIDVDVALQAMPERLPPATQLQLFRIVQEALANVRRHAGARRAWVGGATEGGMLVLTIADDGRGFDPGASGPARGTAHGLSMMRERAEGCGGSLRVDSRPGAGTRVTATVPLVGAHAAGRGDRATPTGR